MITLRLLEEELSEYRLGLRAMGYSVGMEEEVGEVLAFGVRRRALLASLRPLEEAQKLAEKRPGREGRAPQAEEREELIRRGGTIRALRRELLLVEEVLERRLRPLPPGVAGRVLAGEMLPSVLFGPAPISFPYPPKSGVEMGERLGVCRGGGSRGPVGSGGSSGRGGLKNLGGSACLGGSAGLGGLKNLGGLKGLGGTAGLGGSKNLGSSGGLGGLKNLGDSKGLCSSALSAGDLEVLPQMQWGKRVDREAFAPSPWEGGEWPGRVAPLADGGGWQGMGLELLSLLGLHLHRALWNAGFYGQEVAPFAGAMGGAGEAAGKGFYGADFSRKKGYLMSPAGLSLWQLVPQVGCEGALLALGKGLGEILGELGLSLRLSDLPVEGLFGLDCRQALLLEGWSPKENAYRPLVVLGERGKAMGRGIGRGYGSGSGLGLGCGSGSGSANTPGVARKNSGGETLLLGSALSVGAVLLLLMENGQRDDGGVTLPPVLAKGMGEEVLYRR